MYGEGARKLTIQKYNSMYMITLKDCKLASKSDPLTKLLNIFPYLKGSTHA
jgi:hypothetical protein